MKSFTSHKEENGRVIRTNILYMSDNVGLGGGETSLLNHLIKIKNDPYFPIVVCPEEGELTFELSKIGIKVEIVPFKPIKQYGRIFIKYPIISTYKLLRLLKREKIRIVNANAFNSMAIIAPVTKLSNTPLVWTCHGWWPTGKLTGIFVNYFTDKVIAVSHYVENKLINDGYINPSKIIRIPLGIDLSKYSNANSTDSVRAEFGLDRDVPVVGMIGRFQKIKGHHIFVKMVSEIIKTHPHIRFFIIGSEVFNNKSEYDYSQEIHKLIYKLGLEKKIVLTGFRKDISRLIKFLDVLVVPSEIETFGMVVLEAMAANVPVVSCAKGGPTEIINDGENGFIINKQDPEALAEKVLHIIENQKLSSAITLNGKKTVTEQYQINDQVSKIEFLYKELIGSNNNENFNR